MKLKLHHLNLCSKDVPGMEEFYRSVMALHPESSLSSARNTTQGYAAPVAFMTDGQTQGSIWPRQITASASAPITSSIRLSAAASPSAPMILKLSKGGLMRKTSHIPTTANGQ